MARKSAAEDQFNPEIKPKSNMPECLKPTARKEVLEERRNSDAKQEQESHNTYLIGLSLLTVGYKSWRFQPDSGNGLVYQGGTSGEKRL